MLMLLTGMQSYADDVDAGLVADVDTVADAASPAQHHGHWSLGAIANMSYLIPKGPYAGAILHSYGTSMYELRAKWQADAADNDPYEKGLNRPTLQAGLLYGDFSHIHMHKGTTPYESRIGSLWALYGGVQYDVVRRQRWNLGVDLQNGVGYCPHPFDAQTNIDNELIGAPLSIFVNIGFYARYRLSPTWSTVLGVDFKHFSNGSLKRPNLGVNTIGPSLTVQYDFGGKSKPDNPINPENPDYPENPEYLENPDIKKGPFVEVTAAFGMKSLLDHFNVYHANHCPLYGFFATMVAPMYRYHRMHASGVAIDYTYADYVYSHRDLDQKLGRHDERYSPHILGLSLRHELYYHHFSLAVGAGVYLHKQTGFLGRTEDGRFFQNIGLRYAFPFTRDRLFVGYNIKAHRFAKADCAQLLLGYRFK